MNETTERVLTEKIEAQEREIETLRAQLREAEDLSAARAVRLLRARGAILLNISESLGDLRAEVELALGAGETERVFDTIFDLNAFPLPPATIRSFKEACDYGMTRW